MRAFAVAALAALMGVCEAFVPSALPLLPQQHSGCSKVSLSARRSGVVGRQQLVSRPSLSQTKMSAEYDILSGVQVTSVATGESMPVTSTWSKTGGKALVVLLTHFGDLTCWEYAQKLRYYLPQLEAQGVQVRMIGIGGAAAAAEFADSNMIPKELLYFDPDASAAAALNLKPGFMRKSVQEPQSNAASPYLRLLPMLLGVGSPGTIPKVLYGYVGDRNYNPEWIPEQLKLTQKGSFPYVDPETFSTLGTGYLRPFELATVRLQNMISVLSRWEALTPENKDLVVQQGGTLVFDGEACVYRYDDKGILVYAPIEEVLKAAQ